MCTSIYHYQKLDKAASDLLSLPHQRTQQWSKMTQKNVQASQSKTTDH